MTPTAVPRRRAAKPALASLIVQPVAKRLARIEGLLLEMRHEQDIKLKRIGKLQEQVEALTERVSGNRGSILQLLAARQRATHR